MSTPDALIARLTELAKSYAERARNEGYERSTGRRVGDTAGLECLFGACAAEAARIAQGLDDAPTPNTNDNTKEERPCLTQ